MIFLNIHSKNLDTSLLWWIDFEFMNFKFLLQDHFSMEMYFFENEKTKYDYIYNTDLYDKVIILNSLWIRN